MPVWNDQKRDDAVRAVEVPPHPELREYYDAGDSRQGFLNELFDRTAYQYRIRVRMSWLPVARAKTAPTTVRM